MLPGVPAAPVGATLRPTANTPRTRARGDPLLAFIDQIVIPFLNTLYGAVGYLGVLAAMAIESAMIPLPSELICRTPGSWSPTRRPSSR